MKFTTFARRSSLAALLLSGAFCSSAARSGAGCRYRRHPYSGRTNLSIHLPDPDGLLPRCR